MRQLDLLNKELNTGPINIEQQGLSLQLIPDYLPLQLSTGLLQHIIEATPWQQPSIKVYGKWHPTPRLVAFYGDPGLRYQYSNKLHGTLPWTPELHSLRLSLEQHCKASFNCVLLNHYRDGQDTMGWHADDEPELGKTPVIASLSLGAARDIHFKPRTYKAEKTRLNLAGGSLLVMSGTTQQHWLHHIPKRARCHQPRINLTFRHVISSKEKVG